MKKFLRTAIIGVVLLGGIFPLLIGSSNPVLAEDRVTLTLLGTKLGTDAYNFAQALGDIVNKNHSWIRVSVVETIGSGDNIKQMADLKDKPDQARVHFASAIDGLLSAALRGKGPFKKMGPFTEWRVLCTLYTAGPHFMTLDPNIKDPKKDLIGKRIGLLPKGHGLSKDARFYIDSCWGLKGKVKVINMPTSVAKDALLDGTVDVICSGGMYFSPNEIKTSPFNESILAARKNVYFIGIDEKDYEAGMAKVPHAARTWAPVKAGARRPGYPARDWGMLRVGMTWWALKDMDDKVAYELVKTLAENSGKFKGYFAAGKAVNLDNFTANVWKTERYHPGALKYYKEKGVPIKGRL